MRSFNVNFTTEKNKRGTAPINLMTWGFSTPVYVSDRDVTPPGGSAHRGIIKDWGFVDSSLQQSAGSGILDTLEIPDMVVTLINSESTPFSDNFSDSDPPENVTVTLYQWFDLLLDSEKEIIFKGIVKEVEYYDLFECRVRIQGIWTKYDKMIGEDLIISADDFPGADPDDIGKMRNIVYGDLSNVLCRALKAGVIDTLRDDITDSATSFYVSGSGKADFPSGTVTVQIDDEQIQGIYDQSTMQITSCTRGYNSTTAVGHNAGAVVAEVLTEYVYEAASHPVKSIGDVRVDDVKQTSGFTVYTGQTGDELIGYEGTAVIKFTALPKVVKQVNLDVDEGSHSHAGETEVFTWFFDTVTTTAGSLAYASNIGDGDIHSQGQFSTGDEVKITRTISQSAAGTPKRYRLRLKIGNMDSDCTLRVWLSGTYYGQLNVTYANSTYDFSWQDASGMSWTDFMDEYVTLQQYSGTGNIWVYEAWLEVEYDTTTSSSAATGVALSGNSTAETVIGRRVTCDISGHQDDASGTYTGTAGAIIERPDHVIKHLIVEQLGFPSGDIDSTFTSAGTFYDTNNYAFAVLINRKISAEALLMKLALQCRSRFLVTAYGKARLIVRQLSQGSGHSIVKNEIKADSVRIRRNSADELINHFNIHYDKNHGVETSDASAYAAVMNFSDSTSITRYGQREWKGSQDVFFFDAVTDGAMIAHVGGFLLDYHKLARKLPQFAVFLDNMEIEPGDIVDITHALDSMSGFVCEVQKMLHYLGSAKKKQIDHIEVQAVEN